MSQNFYMIIDKNYLICNLSKFTNLNFFQEKQKNEKRFLDKKRRKIKRKIFEGEKKLERKERRKKYLSNKENDFIGLKGGTLKLKENTKNIHSTKDKSIYSHLLLNQYTNKNFLDYLPNKTIEERISSMREKILSLFPKLERAKSNDELMENEQQKKKDISSFNETNSTKEIDII